MKSGCYKAPLAPGIERQALNHGAGFVTDGGNAAQMEGVEVRGGAGGDAYCLRETPGNL